MTLESDDQRWDAKLSYTNDDDGIWLTTDSDSRNLGFWPTVREVLEAAADLPRSKEHPE